MKELMDTYSSNEVEIEKFLMETVSNLGSLEYRMSNNFKKLFDIFPSLELVYVCDKDSLNQISPNICKNRQNPNPIGRNRRYLLDKVGIFDDIALTKPYVSSANGQTCITVIKREKDKIYFFDFNLLSLLQKMNLVEIQKEFNLVSKGFYLIVAVTMIVLALFTIGYSAYEFVHSVLFKSGMSIESIFKPVIALTLGLAIFDLAKTILEQEVVFKNYSKNSKAEYKVLTKFLITIIIALLIESLMVVFKIAIDNYSLMINAVYLILGVSVLIVSLAVFIYLSRKKV